MVGGAIGIVAANFLMWGSNIALIDFIANATNIRDIDTLFASRLPLVLAIHAGAFGLGLLTSMLAGLLPAYRASKLNPAVVLRQG